MIDGTYASFDDPPVTTLSPKDDSRSLSAAETLSLESHFKPPYWVQDEDAQFCMNFECGQLFDFWVRKHHW
jgi:hypothetical protein